MIDIARKILLHDRLRFAITVSGVAFAVTLVCSQTGLFSGLLSSSTITIEKAAADLWITSRNTANVDFSIPFSENCVQRVRSVPGVERADNLIVWYHRMRLPSGTTESVILYALEHFEHWNLPWRVTHGDVADLRRGNYLMLDESARLRFGHFDPGDYRELGDRRMKVIGLTREARSFTTTPMGFMDYARLQELDPTSLGGKTTYILVKLNQGADPQAVRAAIQERLPYLDVRLRDEWASRSRHYWVASTGLGMSMGLTVFLGCLVGIVIVTQTLYTSVMDHFREFATVKAIGGSNADIYRIIAKQALIAAVLGFAIGAGITELVRTSVPASAPAILVTRQLYAAVFLGTVTLCLAASAVSFHKISRLDPASVFRG